MNQDWTHLRELESESIYILRETVAQFRNPVLLYSIGKDSSVLVHLARKAFYPGPLPFPFLHVDTGYKFKEMIEFRDRFCKEIGARLIVHRNEDAIAAGAQDRKSTRLNSSHLGISYAVFCLKKKIKKKKKKIQHKKKKNKKKKNR